MGALDDLRREIDRLDAEMLRLLAERVEVVRRIFALKRGAGLPSRDAVREREVLARAERCGRPPLDPAACRDLIRLNLEHSRRLTSGEGES